MQPLAEDRRCMLAEHAKMEGAVNVQISGMKRGNQKIWPLT